MREFKVRDIYVFYTEPEDKSNEIGMITGTWYSASTKMYHYRVLIGIDTVK